MGALLGLPTVELGYTALEATHFNSTGQYYNFSNIRYAQPPIGDLRFAAPVPPKGNYALGRGETGRICPQAAPAWMKEVASFLPKYLTGNPNAPPVNISSPISTYPRENEDCLFLDVFVPKKVLEGRHNGCAAPVLVWLHGGGYAEGSKDSSESQNPAGLIARSQNDSAEGIIFVSMNYRLGAFGWLGGSTLLRSKGAANAGLLDQRLGLEWVRDHIARFGGDPKRITVMGQSAGGGSIMHHITSYGGSKPVPFQQAIVQSPAWNPITNAEQQEKLLQTFLSNLGVRTIEEARLLPTERIRMINSLMVALSSYGQYTFGPVVDGTYVPDQPGKLLLEGSYAKDLKTIVGHVPDEGLISTPAAATNESYYEANLPSVFPSASTDALVYITRTLYPPMYDGSQGYRTPLQRAALTITEAFFACNSYYLGRAYEQTSYGYQFSAPPGLHAQDLPYTFYTGPEPGPDATPLGFFDLLAAAIKYGQVASQTTAVAWQEFITSFTQTGTPSGRYLPAPVLPYGTNYSVTDFSLSGVQTIKDPSANRRCEWWQKGLYL
ncbi:MAG: hypothetical protein M1816_001242 [Peltula sp. TS41687]|nr:MAG: hypothetical protein M1816_001242 [Peltula sp. TS41687]